MGSTPSGDEADTATFLGRPWRESATLAARVLEGGSLRVVDGQIDAALDGLDASSGGGECPGGGSVELTDTSDPVGPGDRGTRTGFRRVFDGCAAGGAVLDGSRSSEMLESSQRISTYLVNRTEYALAIVRADGSRTVARGTVENGETDERDRPCDAGRVETDTARFESLSLTDDALGVALDALSTSTVEATEILSAGASVQDCVTEQVMSFDGRAGYTVLSTGARLDVTRSGAVRRGSSSGASSGSGSDAALELRAAGGTDARLRLEASSMPDTALVTIEDGGSTVSFEAPWRFGREGGSD